MSKQRTKIDIDDVLRIYRGLGIVSNSQNGYAAEAMYQVLHGATIDEALDLVIHDMQDEG